MLPLSSALSVREVAVTDVFAPGGYHDLNVTSLDGYLSRLRDHPKHDLPLVYVEQQGKRYAIRDGRHRHLAYWLLQREVMRVVLVEDAA